MANHAGVAFAVMSILVAAPARAVDETALFRSAAMRILADMGLRATDQGAFVCISIDGNAPSDTELAQFRDLGLRDVGTRDECVCVESEPQYRCTRVGSMRLACNVTVGNFDFKSFTNATADMSHSCGWQSGGGQTARFEKVDGEWRYVGTASIMKF